MGGVIVHGRVFRRTKNTIPNGSGYKIDARRCLFTPNSLLSPRPHPSTQACARTRLVRLTSWLILRMAESLGRSVSSLVRASWSALKSRSCACSKWSIYFCVFANQREGR